MVADVPDLVTRSAMACWDDFAAEHPALAVFGAERLQRSTAYLATLRADGAPRVHPVAPVIGGGRLLLFMEPTSPKGDDLRERGSYALHNGVIGTGTGGEFFISGTGRPCDDPDVRHAANEAASYEVEERWVLFELDVTTARCKGYGDVELPEPKTWTSRST